MQFYFLFPAVKTAALYLVSIKGYLRYKTARRLMDHPVYSISYPKYDRFYYQYNSPVWNPLLGIFSNPLNTIFHHYIDWDHYSAHYIPNTVFSFQEQ